MRRSLGCAVAALAAIALSAPPAQAQTTGQDSAIGEGSSGDDIFPAFNFSATSGPNGENPAGSVSVDLLGGIHATGPVTCLSVSGNQATIGFTYRDFATILQVVLHVEDLGSAGSGLDIIDLHAFEPSQRSPTDCSPIPATLQRPVKSGDIRVRDAPVLPSSKDQCKNGGWQSFGTAFDNQGDCVRYVIHHARLACTFERVARGVPAFRSKYGRGPYRLFAWARCLESWIRGEQR
jgi:hypothetical protein